MTHPHGRERLTLDAALSGHRPGTMPAQVGGAPPSPVAAPGRLNTSPPGTRSPGGAP